jgi:hypothetical protein
VSDAQITATGQHTQRRFARANVNLEARYEHAGNTAGLSGKITNIGGGGARLASAEDLARDTVVTLRFTLPKIDHEIMVRGKVVMSFYDASQSAFLHGVAFTQAVRTDQDAIVAHVESIEHEASDKG